MALMRGKGGSMHIADFGIGMLGANGIVAGGIPIVTGAGLAAQMDGKGRVAVDVLAMIAGTVVIYAFGVSWLVKGETLWRDPS